MATDTGSAATVSVTAFITLLLQTALTPEWGGRRRSGPAGPPAEPGSPQGQNAEEVSAHRARRRPSAAGLKGSVAHPTDEESYKLQTMGTGRRSPGPISAAWKNRNPQGGLTDRRAGARPAMLIVTRRAETRQGLGRSAEIERRSRKEEPTPTCNF
jgi:hypothetical protein